MIIAVCGTIVLATGFGALLSHLWNTRAIDGLSSKRDLLTIQVLHNMNTLKVGDTLPAYNLVDEKRLKTNVRGQIAHKTLICFIEPGCGACSAELQNLWELTTTETLPTE